MSNTIKGIKIYVEKVEVIPFEKELIPLNL